MEKTKENSEQQADIIKMIAIPIMMLDVDYCIDAAKEMLNQASRQEAMSVHKLNHPQIKNDILLKKGKALLTLCEYVKALKEIDELNLQLAKEQQSRDKISKLFI